MNLAIFFPYKINTIFLQRFIIRMPSVKTNFLYSSILTTANYIFPLLTYPYVSRVLGVEKIGICNFIDSIINYFILFSMMGISITGIREIAKYKNNQTELNKTFSSLIVLNIISTTIMLLILVAVTYTIPQLYEHKELMYIGGLKLMSNFLLIEWFYKGLEEFKYITKRTLIVKSIYVLSIFIFIHNPKDYILYYAILTMMITINAIINTIHSRKFIEFSINKISIKPFVKPFISLGIYMLLTSMYTSFNIAYLGFVSGATEVGYYTTATKLHSIILSIFTAFTGVMLPRMSSLIAENKYEDFKNMFYKSVNILFGLSIPLIIFSIILSPCIIYIISGKGYEGAIIPMQIVMPLILIIGYEQILIIQALMPLKKDKAILINSMVGAGVSLICNLIFVTSYKSIGSAIVWLISELTVLCIAQYFITKYIRIKFPLILMLKNIIYNIPLGIILYLVNISFSNVHLLKIIVSIIILVIYSAIVQLKILKNPTFNSLLIQATNKFTKLRREQ